MSVNHYENFPVASRLCPAAIRPAVVAIYHFARTADDLADEGEAPLAWRQTQLQAMRQALQACYLPRAPAGAPCRWPQVFEPLRAAIESHRLPYEPLNHLLEAFEQDLIQPRHDDRQSLLRYCSRSANPVGRLLLHLYGLDDTQSQLQSDHICTALQLANFWQDISVDLPRGRVYVPGDALRAHGLAAPPGLNTLGTQASAARGQCVRELALWARTLMNEGADLPSRVSQVAGRRAALELECVIQGGLRILEKILRQPDAVWWRRPRLHVVDAFLILQRALWRRLTAPRASLTLSDSRTHES
jgi:squalene synthase HpnC